MHPCVNIQTYIFCYKFLLTKRRSLEGVKNERAITQKDHSIAPQMTKTKANMVGIVQKETID